MNTKSETTRERGKKPGVHRAAKRKSGPPVARKLTLIGPDHVTVVKLSKKVPGGIHVVSAKGAPVRGLRLDRDARTGQLVSATLPYNVFLSLSVGDEGAASLRAALASLVENRAAADARDAAEDAADVASAERVRARIAAGEEEVLPLAMVKRLLSGESRVRVWREHRGLTQSALATKAGLAQENVSQIETGARAATVETLQRVARALDVSLDDIAPLPPED